MLVLVFGKMKNRKDQTPDAFQNCYPPFDLKVYRFRKILLVSSLDWCFVLLRPKVLLDLMGE